jgi:hypothetical protein
VNYKKKKISPDIACPGDKEDLPSHILGLGGDRKMKAKNENKKI